MEHGDSSALGEAADEPSGWREQVALARTLVVQRKLQEAIGVARRAVALAPDEAETHIALADALLAVFPRRMSNRAAAFAELDQAELLGVDAKDLASRRDAPKSLGFWIVYWPCFFLFINYGCEGVGGDVGTAIAWPGMVMFLVATFVVSRRVKGRPFRETLTTKKTLSRRRLATDAQVAASTPTFMAVLAGLVLPAGLISIPGVDGDPPRLVLAWLTVLGIPLAYLTIWIGVNRWLRPGTAIRALRHDAYAACSVPIAFILGMSSPVLALLEVQRPGLWFTLFLTQLAWVLGSFITGPMLSTRRKKALS